MVWAHAGGGAAGLARGGRDGRECGAWGQPVFEDLFTLLEARESAWKDSMRELLMCLQATHHAIVERNTAELAARHYATMLQRKALLALADNYLWQQASPLLSCRCMPQPALARVSDLDSALETPTLMQNRLLVAPASTLGLCAMAVCCRRRRCKCTKWWDTCGAGGSRCSSTPGGR